METVCKGIKAVTAFGVGNFWGHQVELKGPDAMALGNCPVLSGSISTLMAN